ncbi:hypothetical protein HZQ01_14220 [Elizabethkingia anophelis]|nr:hypothetical protein [Elizabethkingia anophelis]
MKHQLPPIENDKIFEDLICDLFNAEYNTLTFKKFGKQGHNQKGIDILSVEHDMAIQCKKKDISRSPVSLRKELLQNIKDDAIKAKELTIDINFFYLVSTFNEHPCFDEECDSVKKTSECNFEILYWGWETIQERILNHPEILEKYYPQFIIKADNKKEKFLKNQELKRRIKEDFKPWINYPLHNRKQNSGILLRKFDDVTYPKTNEPNEFGEYNWFKVGIYRPYDKGIEFIIDIKEIEPLEDNKWRFIRQNENTINSYKVYSIGRINYSEIVDYDIAGGEYDICPHIYCLFSHQGSPFEEIYYEDIEKLYVQFFDVDMARENV